MQSHSKIPFSDGLQNTSLDTKFKRAFNNTEVHLNVLRAAIALFILELTFFFGLPFLKKFQPVKGLAGECVQPCNVTHQCHGQDFK